MANQIFIQTVENPCKTFCKTLCIFIVKVGVKIYSKIFSVYKLLLSSIFSHPFHYSFHNHPPLNFNYFIHYSTNPTTKTINNLIIRKDEK